MERAEHKASQGGNGVASIFSAVSEQERAMPRALSVISLRVKKKKKKKKINHDLRMPGLFWFK